MPSAHRGRMGWRVPVVLSLTLLASLVITGPVRAQDDHAADVEAFRAAVGEARDTAQSRTDEIIRTAEDGCRDIATEACQKQVAAPTEVALARETTAFADYLEGLLVPDVYAEDVVAQVAALRQIAVLHEQMSAAAESADDVLLSEIDSDIRSAFAGLATELSPEYASFAFLSDFGTNDLLSVSAELTAEDLEYLGGVRAAPGAAQSNFSCFNRAMQSAYGTTDALLGALYDCGAGTALAAIEAQTQLLTPPQRFADAHAWLLAGRAEGSRLDGLIGEAARDGDVISFLTNNVRLGLVLRPYPGIDPAFLAAAVGRPILSLDATDPLARSDYGRGLFAALTDYQINNPLFSALGVDFPQVPREKVLQALVEVAPELRALDDELRANIEALDPPEELAADQVMMLDFFSGRRDRLDELFDAAAAGDDSLLFTIGDTATAEQCAVTAALSDAIGPIAAPYFDPNDPDCR